VRPRDTAFGMRGHFIPTRSVGERPGPTGEMLEWSQRCRYGRAEPAPPGGVNVGERPCGVNSGMTPRVVFSEGRTLCVRVVRPNECQGISFPPHALKIAPVAYRSHASVKPMPPFRACGARPSTGWTIRRGDGLPAKAPGIGGGRFSRRDALCAPECLGRTQAPLWHAGREVDEGPVAYRGNAQVEPMVSSRACGAGPSAGGQPGTDGLVGKTRG
jgi:hypothetical protein